MEKTLLVDGDNLFKIGFHGVKEYYHNGNHIGGLFHFINTLRRHLDENNFDKVLVFWDGPDNSIVRQKIYPNYKQNRRTSLNEFQKDNYYWQKNRFFGKKTSTARTVKKSKLIFIICLCTIKKLKLHKMPYL